MAIAGMTTPLRKATYKKLVLNAGALLTDFDPSEYATAAALKTALATALADTTKVLGATRGGSTFNFTREMRQVEADGVRYRFVGDTMVDSADAYIGTTLLEIGDPNIVKKALGTADVTTTGDKTLMQIRTRILEADYLENLCYVCDVSDGGYQIIWLKNALNTNDLNITYTDKGEATLPVEFHAFQDDVEDYDYAPFEVIYLKGAEAVQGSAQQQGDSQQQGSTEGQGSTSGQGN